MRFGVIGFIFLIIISFGTGCLNTSKRPKVGFMLPNMVAMRYSIERDLFTAKLNELGADVIFEQADNDEQKQMVQFESLLKQDIKILVLDPVNRFTAAQMVRKAHSMGIKVISYDRLISNSDVDAFISFDPWMTGRQMTEAVTKLKPEGNYIILGGDRADLNAIGIDEGQQKVLEPFIKSGKIKVKYKVFIEKWDAEDAFYEVGKYIDLSGEVPDVILTSSDVLARGTINVLKQYKLEGKVIVPGQGGELFACKNILKGHQAMTVYKPSKKIAYLAAELAMKMLNKEKVDDILNTTLHNGFSDIPAHLIATIPVNAGNIHSTIVADGMFKEADLNN
jgi:D-xylose transport system substrate-binding protein